MAALRVYRALRDAINDGWQIYDRSHDGYVIRRWNASTVKWEMGSVLLNGRSTPTPLGQPPEIKTCPGHI